MTPLTRVLVVLSVLTLAACSSTDTEVDPQSGSESSPSQALSRDPATATNMNPFRDREIRGHASVGSLWAAFYHTRSGEPVKTVWRMTGHGDLVVTATGPDGQTLHPHGTPEPHAGSNWNRPGDELGVFWTIPQAGQWTFHVKRDDRSGTVVVDFS